MSMIGDFRRCPDHILEEFLHTPEGIIPFLEDEQEGCTDFSVDKAWHAIHFLLTAGVEPCPPLDFILSGGRTVGEVDFGYELPRVFLSGETKAIWEAVEPIDSGLLETRYDPARMNKIPIYPSAWGPVLDEYFLGAYEELRRFLETAVKEREGLIVTIT
jgi:hypothetical protein